MILSKDIGVLWSSAEAPGRHFPTKAGCLVTIKRLISFRESIEEIELRSDPIAILDGYCGRRIGFVVGYLTGQRLQGWVIQLSVFPPDRSSYSFAYWINNVVSLKLESSVLRMRLGTTWQQIIRFINLGSVKLHGKLTILLSFLLSPHKTVNKSNRRCRSK